MYNHRAIEKKWQAIWEQTKAFKTTNSHSQKFYVLDMFPYPSGQGLHVGHPEGYTATDIIARYKRLNGFDVLHPIGWDAFGLPAEQYALSTGNHPETFTMQNINNFRKQLKALGFSFDYDKEVNTTDPHFYSQTQWIFSKLYEKGLAEIKDIDVNWCEELGTVLANEEVITLKDGTKVSERGNFPVIKKPMQQWVLKITAYADRLYHDLDKVNWPKSLINLQRNWIKNFDGTLHLRDWIFSRQRYWGEPFPIAYDNKGEILLIKDLPILLPKLNKIKPSGNGKSPLVNARDWLYFVKDGKKYVRETNTMPQWAGSSWYYLAYILKNDDNTYEKLDSIEAKKRFAKWLPVDLYIGGQEHAVLHLLYARFWHKVLFDCGILPTDEPFYRVVNQGMILGSDGHKMSKSLGNIVSPDQIIREYGADTLRIYEMFMGPLEETKKWSNQSIKAMRKWLERVNNVLKKTKINELNDKSSVNSEYNILIRDVTNNIEQLKFNLAISNLMIFINHLAQNGDMTLEQLRGFLVVLSVFAPFLSEELLANYNLLPIKNQTWPNYDENKIKPSENIIAVQIDGKLRGTIIISENTTSKEIEKLALNLENVQKHLRGLKIVKTYYINKKIFNIVTS